MSTNVRVLWTPTLQDKLLEIVFFNDAADLSSPAFYRFVASNISNATGTLVSAADVKIKLANLASEHSPSSSQIFAPLSTPLRAPPPLKTEDGIDIRALRDRLSSKMMSPSPPSSTAFKRKRAPTLNPSKAEQSSVLSQPSDPSFFAPKNKKSCNSKGIKEEESATARWEALGLWSSR
ncbi:uncharacterized protein KY384_000115 [Bacidia gigantensis]|uniref:uncharacterized protein n=1 Tax=Bacidia gigantensis TaxID=2732470 RepID=UPI001D04F8FB|nr:uncharacterized protein KY384_000115 [Bacidia gigantensis]KAG8526122.1 hypothetical protein KY384_000115 [Bacidia gigantensis]